MMLPGRVAYSIPPKKIERVRLPGLGDRVTLTYEFIITDEGQSRLRVKNKDYPNLGITVEVEPGIESTTPLDRLIIVDDEVGSKVYTECKDCTQRPPQEKTCDKRLHKIMTNAACPSNKAYFGDRT